MSSICSNVGGTFTAALTYSFFRRRKNTFSTQSGHCLTAKGQLVKPAQLPQVSNVNTTRLSESIR